MTVTQIASDRLIDGAIRNRISQLEKSECTIRKDDPFFVADLGQVHRQHCRWTRCIPNIQPFYAVKCNSDQLLLSRLAELGAGFDCASISEMQAVLQLGVDPSRIIFANPCKSASSVSYARNMGITRTTFDNMDELSTIKTYHPDAELFLRIFAEDPTALISLGDKFGAEPDSTDLLLRRAKELSLNVIGISFHVENGGADQPGSGASSVQCFLTAIKHAKLAISQAEHLGFRIQALDIGGGFQDCNFETIASAVQSAIGQEIPKHIKIFAEPGRFYARPFYTMACKVISRRKQVSKSKSGYPDMLYQNDGVYGSFMNVLLEKEIVAPTLMQNTNSAVVDQRDFGEYHYSIWGPTCDSIDCVAKDAALDSEVLVGDWLKYKNMGAYTVSTSTQFNGFGNRYHVSYLDTERLATPLETFCEK
ncbi:hypothetical protein FQN54_006182 [Arachnomyces sp. PD_36]|nr:hypothetical protein FQN54_006182 [Arachnomyces sp. PD_36]